MGDLTISSSPSVAACTTPMGDTAAPGKVLFKPGDTLQSIAACTGVEVGDLMAENNITDPNFRVITPTQLSLPTQNHVTTPPSTDKTAVQAPSTPNAGTVDAKSDVQVRLREGAVRAVLGKAMAGGLRPEEAINLANNLAGLPEADFKRETTLINDALKSENPDRALRTYLDITPERMAHPDRITPEIERALVTGVGNRRTQTLSGQAGILGEDSARRAADTLIHMPAKDYAQISNALGMAGSGGGPNSSRQTEQALILKAVGARQGYFVDPHWSTKARNRMGEPEFPTQEVLDLAEKIVGKDRSELIEKSTVLDLSMTQDGKALQQRFTCSCAPTTAQIARAEADPYSAQINCYLRIG